MNTPFYVRAPAILNPIHTANLQGEHMGPLSEYPKKIPASQSCLQNTCRETDMNAAAVDLQ